MSELFNEFKTFSSTHQLLSFLTPPDKTYHKDRCKTTSQSDDELQGVAVLETWGMGNFAISNLPFHPLLEPLILEKVIGYLDSKSMKNARLVCQRWNEEVQYAATNEFPIRIKKTDDAVTFLKLMDTQNTQLPIRHLQISNPQKIHLKEAVGLMKLVCPSIQTLILEDLDDVEWFYIFLEFLASSCPKLDMLILEFQAEKFHHIKDRVPKYGFPCLKHLVIDFNNSDHKSIEHLVMYLLDATPALVSFGLKNVRSSQNMNDISYRLSIRPDVICRLEYLDIPTYPCLVLWETMHMNLTTLHISNFDLSFSPEIFSSVLEATSGTLTTLVLKIYHNEAEEFQLCFPCEMKRLEILFVSNEGCQLSGTIHGGSVSLLKRIPKLRMFYYFNDNTKLWMKYNPQFWQNLFHDKNGKPGVVLNTNLLFFQSIVYVIDAEIIHKITTAFPALCHLHLEINGNLLAEIFHTMKNFKLEEFSFVYFETSRGIVAFDSALTGISEEDCQEMLENEGYRRQHDIEKMRVRSSLADFKYLRRLKIQYKKQNSEYEQLDGVAIFHGLLATSIKHLDFGNFKIDERFVLKMLKKLPLNTFILRPGIVHVRGTDQVNYIKKRFPNVDCTFPRY